MSQEETNCREVRKFLRLKSFCCRECHAAGKKYTIQVKGHRVELCCATLSEVVFHQPEVMGSLSLAAIARMVAYLQQLARSSRPANDTLR